MYIIFINFRVGWQESAKGNQTKPLSDHFEDEEACFEVLVSCWTHQLVSFSRVL